jgi:hypothetical protein
MPNQTRHCMVSIDEKNLMQLGGELMILTSVVIGHKIYLVTKARFLKMKGEKINFHSIWKN